MNTQQAFQLFVQCSDFTISQLPEPARAATLEKMQMAARVLAQAIAPAPQPARKIAPVKPADGAANFPETEPEATNGDDA